MCIFGQNQLPRINLAAGFSSLSYLLFGVLFEFSRSLNIIKEQDISDENVLMWLVLLRFVLFHPLTN